MTRLQHYLARMWVFVICVLGIAALLSAPLSHFFLGNAPINGLILLILLGGVVYIFRQVMRLRPEVAWIENFRRDQGSISGQRPPRLL